MPLDKIKEVVSMNRSVNKVQSLNRPKLEDLNDKEKKKYPLNYEKTIINSLNKCDIFNL